MNRSDRQLAQSGKFAQFFRGPVAEHRAELRCPFGKAAHW